jgi:hypothetical protein
VSAKDAQVAGDISSHDTVASVDHAQLVKQVKALNGLDMVSLHVRVLEKNKTQIIAKNLQV